MVAIILRLVYLQCESSSVCNERHPLVFFDLLVVTFWFWRQDDPSLRYHDFATQLRKNAVDGTFGFTN